MIYTEGSVLVKSDMLFLMGFVRTVIVLFEIRIDPDLKEFFRKGSSDVIYTLALWPETTFLS